MLKEYTIIIQGSEQSKSYHIEKGDDLIFINKIPLPKATSEQINIIIKNKGKANQYKIKLNSRKKKKKSNIFLFNYNLKPLTKEIQFVNWKSLFFMLNEQKYINISFSNDEKYLYFYQYFFDKYNSINESNLCYELIQTYLEEKTGIGNRKDLPIDIGISILIIY